MVAQSHWELPEEEYQQKLSLLVTRNPLTLNYCCKICSQEASSTRNVKIHIEAKHLKLSRYPCSYCQSRFHTKAARHMHVRQIHKEQDILHKAGLTQYINK